MLPKTYAVRHAEQVALAVAPLLLVVTRALGPITKAVHVVVNWMISFLSIAPKDDMSGVDVLRGTMEMYHEEGSMLTDDKEMLSGVFDLGDTEIAQVMRQRREILAINIDEPFDRLVNLAAESLHSRIPLWEGASDRIVGILHVKDLFRAIHAEQQNGNPIDVRALMRAPWFVPEATTCKNQLKAFQERKSHIAMVVDEFGSVTGLITLEDILEEVVGEIEDEHDLPAPKGIRALKDGTYSIDGAMTLREINRSLEWNLVDDDDTTLAGYVIRIAQCIPEVDEIFETDGFMFKIMKREENRLSLIQVRRIGESVPTGAPDAKAD